MFANRLFSALSTALLLLAFGISLIVGQMQSARAEGAKTWNCIHRDGSRASDKDCKRTNYCLQSGEQSCREFVGDRKNDPQFEFLMHKCTQEKQVECMRAVRSNKSGSTNLTDAPDAWNCVTNKGNRVSDADCRRTNFCLDAGSRDCAESLGARKYGPDGEGLMKQCTRQKAVACMRAVK